MHDIADVQGISWTTLRYMIGEVQYGGRVTDDYDKRLLNTYAKVWFSENIFSDNFQFYQGADVILPKFSYVCEKVKTLAFQFYCHCILYQFFAITVEFSISVSHSRKPAVNDSWLLRLIINPAIRHSNYLSNREVCDLTLIPHARSYIMDYND